MEINVTSKYLRISPRKLRLVVNSVRGKNAMLAKQILQFQMKKGSNCVASLLDSAIAIAKNSEVGVEKFTVTKVTCSDGPRLKRGTPVSKGHMAPIKKRQSHLQLTLSDEQPKLLKPLKILKENSNGAKS